MAFLLSLEVFRKHQLLEFRMPVARHALVHLDVDSRGRALAEGNDVALAHAGACQDVMPIVPTRSSNAAAWFASDGQIYVRSFPIPMANLTPRLSPSPSLIPSGARNILLSAASRPGDRLDSLEGISRRPITDWRPSVAQLRDGSIRLSVLSRCT
jgi:hypothetical protein